MSSAKQTVKTVYNDRVQLTAGERATIDALNASIAADRLPEGYDALTAFRKSLAKEAREALGSAIPDLEERGRAQRERIMPELERLKGTAWPTHGFEGIVRPALQLPLPGHIPPDPPVHQLPLPGHIPPPVQSVLEQPANMGELWRASSSGFTSDPNLVFEVDHDPLRIFGHIGYASDALFTGTVGLGMTFILPPERMERTDRTVFEVRPDLRVNGFISGWTGYYHPIFAADDKWSKCWESLEATLMLSSDERLTGDSVQENLFFLDDVAPVGQANPHRVFGWGPILRFTANMRDLRQRGVSIILKTALRYDFQLEGESDIWFRNRSGSATESVPAFDNALTFRCSPGVVTSIP